MGILWAHTGAIGCVGLISTPSVCNHKRPSQELELNCNIGRVSSCIEHTVEHHTYIYPLVECHTYIYPLVECHTYIYPLVECHTYIYPLVKCHTYVRTMIVDLSSPMGDSAFDSKTRALCSLDEYPLVPV